MTATFTAMRTSLPGSGLLRSKLHKTRSNVDIDDQWAGPVKYNSGNFNVTVFAKPNESHDASTQKRIHIKKRR